MKNRIDTSDTKSAQNASEHQSQLRFADWNNLPKPRWRDALKALALPATRVHRYRNLRTAIFYETVDDHDCNDRS